MTETEKSWIAGIVDGEGCLTISKTKPSPKSTNRSISYRPIIKVTMGDKATIDRISILFGFSSTMTHRLSANPNWNDAFTWSASNRQAIRAIETIRPYLFTKAAEADVLLEFGNLCNSRTGRRGVPPELLAAREKLWATCKSLKPKSNTKRFLSNL